MAAAKAVARERALAARRSLADPARAAAQAAICAHLAALDVLAHARVVSAYAGKAPEVVIDEFLRTVLDRDAGLLLPWVAGDDLAVGRVRDLDRDLVLGWRGIREPDPQRRRPARPDRIEAAIVPGVAFDRHGRRLGYGGGYFDRLVTRLRPDTPVIGVAFAVQVVDLLPEAAHDRRVSMLVTEDGVLPIALQ
jgi:5-formyltetrahydrofolate cyclo-ligase